MSDNPSVTDSCGRFGLSGTALGRPAPCSQIRFQPQTRRPKRKEVRYVHERESGSSAAKKAKDVTDKYVWVEGSASVAHQFMAKDLLDEVILFTVADSTWWWSQVLW